MIGGLELYLHTLVIYSLVPAAPLFDVSCFKAMSPGCSFGEWCYVNTQFDVYILLVSNERTGACLYSNT